MEKENIIAEKQMETSNMFDMESFYSIVGRSKNVTIEPNFIEFIDSFTNEYYDYSIKGDKVDWGLQSAESWFNLNGTPLANPNTISKIQRWMKENNFSGRIHYVVDMGLVMG